MAVDASEALEEYPIAAANPVDLRTAFPSMKLHPA